MNIKDSDRIIAVDLDNTLCHGEFWSHDDCLKAKPKKKMIEYVNKLSLTKFIVIYTARRDSQIEDSIRWLKKHGVKFHAISNNKMPADCYIDDRAINPQVIG